MELPFRKIVKTEKETESIALQFAEMLKLTGDKLNIVSLNGNLGSGKTTIVKYIASYFKITNVTSPSFSIVNEYSGTKKIYHFDFYRLKKIEELYDIGFEDYLNDTESIILIEWGNIFEKILPEERIEINIEIINETERKIEIKYKR